MGFQTEICAQRERRNLKCSHCVCRKFGHSAKLVAHSLNTPTWRRSADSSTIDQKEGSDSLVAGELCLISRASTRSSRTLSAMRGDIPLMTERAYSLVWNIHGITQGS